MTLTDEDVRTIAAKLPAPLQAPPDVIDMAMRLEDPPLQRTLAAAARLQLAFTSRPVVPWPNRAWLVTYGFIPMGEPVSVRGSDFPNSGRFTFGVSILADGSSGTDPAEEPQEILGAVRLDETLLPVILTQARLVPHAPPHLDALGMMGSCACWAKYSGTRNVGWSQGLLTARHVVERIPFGTSVTLDPSGSPAFAGTVGDYGACTVDAAAINVPLGYWPPGLKRMPLPGPYGNPIAPGIGIGLEGRFTVPRRPGKVVSHHPLPGYWGSMMGQRLLTDVVGQAGDSGGWVDRLSDRQGLGIYMGMVNDGNQGQHGLCQDLHQACVYLEADIYR